MEMEQGLLLPLHQDPVLSEGMSLEELVQLLRQVCAHDIPAVQAKLLLHSNAD